MLHFVTRVCGTSWYYNNFFLGGEGQRQNLPAYFQTNAWKMLEYRSSPHFFFFFAGKETDSSNQTPNSIKIRHPDFYVIPTSGSEVSPKCDQLSRRCRITGSVMSVLSADRNQLGPTWFGVNESGVIVQTCCCLSAELIEKACCFHSVVDCSFKSQLVNAFASQPGRLRL